MGKVGGGRPVPVIISPKLPALDFPGVLTESDSVENIAAAMAIQEPVNAAGTKKVHKSNLKEDSISGGKIDSASKKRSKKKYK